MRIPALFFALAAAGIVAVAGKPAPAGAGAAPTVSADIPASCASCHALTKPAEATLDRLWNRKGPDLWYSGDKFNRDWLVAWLQNPTPIRPGGVLWFRNAKAGVPHDTLDMAAVEKHPAVDAGSAAKVADALLQLKGEGLVTEGEYKPTGGSLMMGQMSFTKLRGCSSCHQDKPGQGGVSGPELFDAGRRLRPDYVLAYTRDPQRFDPHIWMPRLPLSDPDLQRVTGYVVSLGKEQQ